MARSAPFSLTTMPMISTSSGGSRSLRTFLESASCGTAAGETKETASRCLKPAFISDLRYADLMSGGIRPLRPCQASRGHSMSLTDEDMFENLFTTETRRKTDTGIGTIKRCDARLVSAAGGRQVLRHARDDKLSC